MGLMNPRRSLQLLAVLVSGSSWLGTDVHAGTKDLLLVKDGEARASIVIAAQADAKKPVRGTGTPDLRRQDFRRCTADRGPTRTKSPGRHCWWAEPRDGRAGMNVPSGLTHSRRE